MRIKMLETRRGSEDGFVVKRFEKGWEGEVADTLARTFLKAGWAHTAELCSAAQTVATAAQDIDTLARAHTDFDRIFRPQSTRGSGSQNPATLLAAGKL